MANAPLPGEYVPASRATPGLTARFAHVPPAQHGVMWPPPMTMRTILSSVPIEESVTLPPANVSARPCSRDRHANGDRVRMIAVGEDDVYPPRHWRGCKIQAYCGRNRGVLVMIFVPVIPRAQTESTMHALQYMCTRLHGRLIDSMDVSATRAILGMIAVCAPVRWAMILLQLLN